MSIMELSLMNGIHGVALHVYNPISLSNKPPPLVLTQNTIYIYLYIYIYIYIY